jgi:6-phospho-3-hexuloisomerase
MVSNEEASSRPLRAGWPNRKGHIVNPTASATSAVFSSTDDIVRNLSLVRDEIAATAAKIDEEEMAGLAGHLGQSGRVFVAGAGRSGLVLRMAAMRLMHLGLTVHVAGDTTTPAISSGDLLLVASGSGTTSGVVKSAETAAKAGARIAAFTTNPESPLANLADALVVIPAAQKTDHGSSVSRQYSGSLFEQVLFLATEALFQSLWDNADEPAEELWLRHANLE